MDEGLQDGLRLCGGGLDGKITMGAILVVKVVFVEGGRG